MLILDKRKAVELVMALTGSSDGLLPAAGQPRPHARTYHRIATYERRPQAVIASPATRRAERRKRRAMAELEAGTG